MIPSFAAGQAFQLQVRAKDRAGNYGVGYSKIILVKGTESLPSASPPADEASTLLPPASAPAS